ncbi:MAG: Holliday junction branch migration protein RuvA [Alphaproteobacteria bacterium]
MIAKLTGQVDSFDTDAVILDVGGVGYHVYVATRTLARLETISGVVSLLIEPLIRQDQISLYGFIDHTERQWFRLLLTIQGVGARVALALLSTLTPEALAAAIAQQDRVAVCRADGVGPKLANRILSELKDKVSTWAAFAAVPLQVNAEEKSSFSEALSALINLGYNRAQASQALTDAHKHSASEDTAVLIRQALQYLSPLKIHG